jgi:hypothetical protein
MPKCRNCHHEISSFDKDICPFCGTENPIASDYKTQDMTQFVDPVSGDYKLYKSKAKKTMALLTMFLGCFGVGFFYIEKKKEGLISLLVTLLWTGGLGSLLFFLVAPLHNALGYVLPFLAIYLAFFIFSLFLFHNDSLKDGNGEFLR